LTTAAFSLTQSVRGELARQGTLVVGVLPGFVDTDMARGVTAEKLSPDTLAEAILEAVRTGTEDVYPGLAADAEAGRRKDEKASEKHWSAVFGV